MNVEGDLMKRIAMLLIFCLLTACAGQTPASAPPTAAPALPPPAVYTLPPRRNRTPVPQPTQAPTITLEPTNTPAQAPLDLFKPYTIPVLRSRGYSGGTLEDLGAMGMGDTFTRYYFRYTSDGLKIYGFMNIPQGDGPFPVIIAAHGYTDQATYDTLDYTTDLADMMTRDGYIVLHPNLRNYRPSGDGDNLFRVGMTVDVLNLVALVKLQAGQEGLLEKADPARIGLWGHSMGGGIVLKAATISPDIKAVLLYASTSGDEQKNSQFFYDSTGSVDNLQELTASPGNFREISPSSYYADITAAVALYHGTADSAVPLEWAQETCDQLKAAGVTVECHFYEGADHTFRSRYMGQFGPSVSAFYDTYLRNSKP